MIIFDAVLFVLAKALVIFLCFFFQRSYLMNYMFSGRDFDLNLIKVLDAVITEGNATKASKRLSVTPAAVSLALTRLQAFYHEALFVRGKEGLVPTEKALDVHQYFRQAIELVNYAMESEQENLQGNNISILGSELAEKYYISQLYDDNIYEKYVFHHSYSKHMNIDDVKNSILTGKHDLIINNEIITDNHIESKCIDSFKKYVCICSFENMLGECSQLSLHQFYSASHAVYQIQNNSLDIIINNHMDNNVLKYKGLRKIGYKSDSVDGIMRIVERTSLIALIPLKLAVFYRNKMKLAIKIMQPPKELNFETINMYASWRKGSIKSEDLNEVVNMMHTLSSFRRT